jgi:hypothetical protein
MRMLEAGLRKRDAALAGSGQGFAHRVAPDFPV